MLAPPPASDMAALKKYSAENSKLPKAARKVFDAGVELAAKGADEETQSRNLDVLARAEERFTFLIDGEEDQPPLAPNYYGSYTNR